ncbi:DUF2207 domain-containing protein [Candidatus Berkelbacteria bacterium]|nr:DUF2207 domain-containing protein [Candidatus Berkelbacteria bacterium]
MNIRFGLYKKTLSFWLLILVFGYFSFQFLTSTVLRAEPREVRDDWLSPAPKTFQVVIKENGQTLINNRRVKNLLFWGREKDVFQFQVAAEPGYFISELNTEISLPATRSERMKPRIYLEHGVGEAAFSYLNDKTLLYQIKDISPTGIATLEISFDKGLITPSSYLVFYGWLLNAPFSFWLLLSALLPSLVILLLFQLFWRRQRLLRTLTPRKELREPPSLLSPAAAGVLLDGLVLPRHLAATLLDLAQRGFILIAVSRNGFSYLKHRPLDLNLAANLGLRPYEAMLLSKIFTAQQPAASKKDILFRVGHRLFSRKIAEVYFGIYQELMDKGFFLKNPRQLFLRLKVLAVSIFFISLLFFALILILPTLPRLFLLPWAGMALAALLILKLAPALPLRTEKGKKELQKWLAFRSFLTDTRLLSYQPNLEEIYERFLPYAVAFAVEEAWSARFLKQRFLLPDWYISKERAFSLEEFARQIFPLVNYTAKLLSESREPLAD